MSNSETSFLLRLSNVIYWVGFAISAGAVCLATFAGVQVVTSTGNMNDFVAIAIISLIFALLINFVAIILRYLINGGFSMLNRSLSFKIIGGSVLIGVLLGGLSAYNTKSKKPEEFNMSSCPALLKSMLNNQFAKLVPHYNDCMNAGYIPEGFVIEKKPDAVVDEKACGIIRGNGKPWEYYQCLSGKPKENN